MPIFVTASPKKTASKTPKKTFHIQNHVIFEAETLWTCGLRHCIAFEQPFNLLMNFNWIENRQHGLHKKNVILKITIHLFEVDFFQIRSL